ncbi:MAG: lysophospholipid acyltransferase family protein [Thermomicrobiales bacterium]
MSARWPDPSDFARGTLGGGLRRVVRAVIFLVLRPLVGYRVVGIENIPATGAVIVAANHLHNLDPLFVDAAVPRRIHYMAKKEAFKNRVVGYLLLRGGAFPIDRGKSDRAAIRRSLATLKQGIPLGLFPEGTRSATMALAQAHSGAGLLALSSGSPVVAAIVTGSERLRFNGSKGKAARALRMPEPGHKGVRVLFGEPFTVPRSIDGRRIGSEEAAEIIMIEIARLLPPEYRGVYTEKLEDETVRRAIPLSG